MVSYIALIFSIATFVLHSVLFLHFVKPTVDEVLRIKGDLRKRVDSPSIWKTDKRLIEKEEKLRTRVNDLMEEYELEHGKLVKYRRIYVGAIVLLFFFGISFIFFSDYSSDYLPTIALSIIFVLLVLLLSFWILRIAIPSPKRLSNWSYTVSEFGMSPMGLFHCADFKLVTEWSDHGQVLSLSTRIKLTGYHYWMIVTDESNNGIILNKIEYVKSGLEKSILDVKDYCTWRKPIDTLELKPGRKYSFDLLIIDPLWFNTSEGQPFIGHFILDFDSPITTTLISSMQSYSGIKYYGKGRKIKKILWARESDRLNPRASFWSAILEGRDRL